MNIILRIIFSTSILFSLVISNAQEESVLISDADFKRHHLSIDALKPFTLLPGINWGKKMHVGYRYKINKFFFGQVSSGFLKADDGDGFNGSFKYNVQGAYFQLGPGFEYNNTGDLAMGLGFNFSASKYRSTAIFKDANLFWNETTLKTEDETKTKFFIEFYSHLKFYLAKKDRVWFALEPHGELRYLLSDKENEWVREPVPGFGRDVFEFGGSKFYLAAGLNFVAEF